MSITFYPGPIQLVPKLPEKFSQWTEGQPEFFGQVMAAIKDPHRFHTFDAPTGIGKSIVAITAAMLSRKKVAYLTPNKALQTQLMGDFGLMAREIRGKNNYLCHNPEDDATTVDEASCNVGVRCPIRHACDYYIARGLALQVDGDNRVINDLLIANITVWLYLSNYIPEFPQFDVLIIDEAHTAAQWLENYLETEISIFDLQRYDIKLRKTAFKTWDEWKAWSNDILVPIAKHNTDLHGEIDDLNALELRPSKRLIQETLRSDDLLRRVQRLASSNSTWVEDRIDRSGESHGWKFAPVWPGQVSEELFGKVPK